VCNGITKLSICSHICLLSTGNDNVHAQRGFGIGLSDDSGFLASCLKLLVMDVSAGEERGNVLVAQSRFSIVGQ